MPQSWAGTFCKKADKEILKDLEMRGLLFSAPVFEHSYPHCWRCDTPLIYYARDTWFIKMTAVKEDLIRNFPLLILNHKVLLLNNKYSLHFLLLHRFHQDLHIMPH